MLKAGLHVQRKHKHTPRVNRDDANIISATTRKRNAFRFLVLASPWFTRGLCLCWRRTCKPALMNWGIRANRPHSLESTNLLRRFLRWVLWLQGTLTGWSHQQGGRASRWNESISQCDFSHQPPRRTRWRHPPPASPRFRASSVWSDRRYRRVEWAGVWSAGGHLWRHCGPPGSSCALLQNFELFEDGGRGLGWWTYFTRSLAVHSGWTGEIRFLSIRPLTDRLPTTHRSNVDHAPTTHLPRTDQISTTFPAAHRSHISRYRPQTDRVKDT